MLKSNAHLASICTQVPTYGIFENISSISQLAAMPQWTEDRPLRVVTGYTYVCPISPCSQGGSILSFVLFVNLLFICFDVGLGIVGEDLSWDRNFCKRMD